MKRLLKNKKGLSIIDYLVGFMVFGLFVSGMYFTVSETQGDSGFWKNYGYTPPTATNNLTQFDSKSTTFQALEDIKCDLNPDLRTCGETSKLAQIAEAGSNIINIMVGGAYGALITITKTVPFAHSVIEDIGHVVGINPYIIEALTIIISLTVFVTVVLIIFNRSDV